MTSVSTSTDPVDVSSFDSTINARWFSGFSENIAQESHEPVNIQKSSPVFKPDRKVSQGVTRHIEDDSDDSTVIDVSAADCLGVGGMIVCHFVCYFFRSR